MVKFAVAIFGPTGVGKTALAIRLAKENNGEIISVDSRQVYKLMDIGTAKPSKEELLEIQHHLIDIVTPDRQFTAGIFIKNAENLIDSIVKKGKIPFLVGGTGLYFSSLMRGMINIPKLDPEIKESLNQNWEKRGQERLFKILERLDNEYSKKIHFNDKQRTLRALEVIKGTGKKFSDFLKQDNQKKDIDYLTIGINKDRKKLYEIIDSRVDKMLDDGLVNEVKGLLSMGYKKEDPGMRSIGYKEIIDFIDDKTDFERAVYLIKRNSRRYAKRQLVWFRKVNNVNWFENNEFEKINELIAKKIDKTSKK